MRITNYTVYTDKISVPLRAACVADLHARPYKKVIEALKTIKPDVILLTGDILEISADYMEKRNQNALDFLREAVDIAPCYYCFGNHEIYYSHAKFGKSKTSDTALLEKHIKKIKGFGVHIVNDAFESFSAEISIGGIVCGRDKDPSLDVKTPDINFLDKYDNKDGFKILLCHYPHYYPEYLKQSSFDLILSGHAHGGQWRIFNRGIYAPHQGLFPKYTSGIHDGRLIISRGSVNNSRPIPRFFNPTEIPFIEIKPKKEI